MSDEEWERFLRESVTGAAQAPVEPSARDREAQGRLRERPGPPAPWRAHPAAARPRRRTGWYTAGFVAALALLAVALFPQQLTGWPRGDDGALDGAPLAAETERPRGAPGDGPRLRPTVAEPFRGSPAARWGDGAAGITVPEARATGWMDAAGVERALRQSRDFLVASSLDPRVLRGERPARAIALLNPHQEDVQRYLRTALSTAAPTPETDPLLLFSRFRPDQALPVGDVVKTRGRLTYREGKRGAVEVTADVTFVYPVTPAAGGGGPDAEVVRTIVRRSIVLSWDDPDKVVTEPGTASLLSYALDMTNGGCGEPTGYFAPPFGAAGGPSATGDPVDPYDRSAPVGGGGGSARDCRAATRS